MKAQEALNRAYIGIVRQGTKSASGDPSEVTCYYRYVNSEGRELRCAVGHLLTEEQLGHIGKSNPPAMGLRSVLPMGTRIVDDLSEDDEVTFLIQLQRAHDGHAMHIDDPSVWMSRFKKSMRDLADRWGLSLPPDPEA